MNVMMIKTLRHLCLSFAALLLIAAGCSKDLESTPSAPAGQPVTVTGQPSPNASRQIQFKNAKVKNKSQRTIYDVRIAITAWLGPPHNKDTTTVTNVLWPSIAHGDSGMVSNVQVPGDVFGAAEARWEWVP